MQIRRLGWAGVEVRASGATAVIDLLEDVSSMASFMGEAHTELPAPAPGSVSLALVTHLHGDHADPDALARALAPDGLVLRPAPAEGERLEVIATEVAEAGLREHGLRTQVVAPWESVQAGPFTVTALPAADGFGDPQVSWIVEADGRRILHAGDTLFHGWWWRARMRTGAIDAAFLPVNAPIVNLPHRQPGSRLPAVMDPRQAVEAAAILEAALAVPIHYATIDHPPVYVPADGAVDTFARLAAERGIRTQVAAPGEEILLTEHEPAAA